MSTMPIVMKKNILFVILLTGLFSCKGPATFRDEKFDNFTISIASFLSPVDKPEIHYSAYLEDTLNNCFFMVVRESKDTMIAYGQKYDLNTYYDKTSKSLFSKLEDGGLANSSMDTVNGCRAIVGRIGGKLQNEHLVYFLAVIETRKAFFQLIFGMPLDQESRYTNDMHRMIGTFKEL